MANNNNIEKYTDKTGRTIVTGDIVKIENAYIKRDNGLFLVTHSPGDPGWCGKNHGLEKLCKSGKISAGKYATSFYPLSYTSNNCDLKAAAREHDSKYATIEIISGVNRTGSIEYFTTEKDNAMEEIDRLKSRGFVADVIKPFQDKVVFLDGVLSYIQPKNDDTPAAPEIAPADTSEDQTTSLSILAGDTHGDAQTGAPDTNSNTITIDDDTPSHSAAQSAESTTEIFPEIDYFVENVETGKLELHFDKSTYLGLADDIKRRIKSNFLFSRYSGAWVSRRKFPHLYRPREIALELGLTDAGEIGENITFEEEQERKAQRAEKRADRLEYKSEKAAQRAEQMQKPIEDMRGDIAFFTQPNINTSAGRAFTRQREKMWAAWENGIEEYRKSEFYQERARKARATAAHTKTTDKGFCMRRIEGAQATIRRQRRFISDYQKTLERLYDGEQIFDWKNEQILPEVYERYIREAEKIIEKSFESIAYYDTLIEIAGGIIDKKSLHIGDIVKIYRWKEPVKIRNLRGTKNFTYEFMEPNMVLADGTPMQGFAAYAEIERIIKEVN